MGVGVICLKTQGSGMAPPGAVRTETRMKRGKEPWEEDSRQEVPGILEAQWWERRLGERRG